MSGLHKTNANPALPPEVPTEADRLVAAVLLASRALVGIAARSLAETPSHVTLAQYRLLVLLSSRGPQLPSTLARAMGAAASSITRLCDRLAAKGLITRQVSPESRREVVLAISPAGEELVRAVSKRRHQELRRILAAVPPGDRQGIVDALNQLSEAAGERPEPSFLLGWEP